MPYFERKPWLESIGKPSELDPSAADEVGGMVQIARSILAAESGREQTLGGPFRCRQPVHPGETGVIVLSVAADADGEPLGLDLSLDDLRSRSGSAIPASLVHLEPKQLTIPPGGSQSFEVHVRVPPAAEPGIYSGRVVGRGPETVGIVVEYQVVPQSPSTHGKG